MATLIKTAQLGETIGNNSWGYIKVSDGKVYKANAAAAASQAAFFINTGNTSGNYVQIIYAGEVELPSAGLTEGAYYFLDPATPGAHTITQGTGAYQQLFKAIDTDRILIDIKAAVPASGGGGGDSLGTGFTSGGGSGTIPDGTVATLDGSFMFSGPVLLDGGDGSEGKHVLLSSADAFSGLTELYSTDEGSVALQYYSDGSGNTSAINFTSSGVDYRTTDGAHLSSLYLTPSAHTFTDGSTAELGIQYAADYSATIATNDRSIPDVGTVRDSLMPLMFPAQLTNAAAANGQLYYSTDDLRLAYKDPGGTVNLLY